ncbi:Ribosome maturation protein SBDS [Wickerhamomyces ciferrii]|uniref:Ribosome maturation protein SDO1 n=1 Tax=Wickerhamomyces ciferrii (strain ATCC 14091 / BCRC 22168 / CBS 111 / JCM 3599 / NBRC 0793 / NRRL Y-1031 F-60-10) TaxID=1206466 RepID=K0KTS8_WICCF|nr:Ribosome maturation protein SBDS [Wickerhamomyces ciferrii]CCH44658.1 Ribosome maturation protein SBDS [Wickerhamomyces ciferrii]
MPINQPSNQIKLTNVSLVRMKKGKKRFEIACYQNKVQDWRSNVEKDIDEVLQIPQVFLNVSKGQVAPNEDLQKSFGSTDTDKIILEILQKGEIQLSEKERQAKGNQIQAETLQLISTKCINPKSKKRYPPTMIQKALAELKFNTVTTKTAKLQALEAIKLLVAKQIIPIVRAKMKIKVLLESKDAKKLNEKIKPLLGDIESEDSGKFWEVVSYIDPVNYRELVEIVGNYKSGQLEVLDMAVIDESEK